MMGRGALTSSQQSTVGGKTTGCQMICLTKVKYTLIEKDHLGDWSFEKDRCLRLTFRQLVRKPSSESSHSGDLTLKVASAQVVETSVANNSPSQNSNHPDDLFQSRYVTPGFKPFSYKSQICCVCFMLMMSVFFSY